MKISVNNISFGELDAGDVFRYDDRFYIVVDLNPKDLGATDYIAVNLVNGAIDEDITDDTDVQYLANATLKAQKKLLYYPLDKWSRGWYNRIIK